MTKFVFTHAGSQAAVGTRVDRVRFAPVRDQVSAGTERRFGPGAASRTAANSGRLCGAFDPHVDFAAERLEVDRLGQQCSVPFSKA